MIQVAMLWLINEKEELLLARRADNKSQDPGLWGPSVTGKLEAGETFEQALAREAEEELALERTSYTPMLLFEADYQHPDGETRKFKVFATHITNEVIKSLEIDPIEVAEIKWLSIPEIRKLLQSKPGEMIVASAFALWNQIFETLQAIPEQK